MIRLIWLLLLLIVTMEPGLAQKTLLEKADLGYEGQIRLYWNKTSQKFGLYTSDEYGVHNTYQYLTKREMKRFRVSFEEARQKALKLPPKTTGRIKSLMFSGVRISIAPTTEAGGRDVTLLFQATKSVDKTAFVIPASKKNHKFKIFKKLIDASNF